MYKVIRSYTKKAERKHELTRSADHHASSQSATLSSSHSPFAVAVGGEEARNGQLVPADDRRVEAYNGSAALGQGFSESSSYETREHFERRVQRVKKTRSERDSNRKAKKSKVSELLATTNGGSARDALLQWAQEVTRGYPGVNIRNFSSSWRDGLAFNAILHRYRPKLIQWSRLSRDGVPARERLQNAFTAAENAFGVHPLLDAVDVDVDSPDEKSIITYVSELYNALPHDTTEYSKYEEAMGRYEQEAAAWLDWVQRATKLMNNRQIPTNASELRRLLEELERFRSTDVPPKAKEKQDLTELYNELYSVFEGTELLNISPDLSPQSLAAAWQRFQKSLDERFGLLDERAGSAQGSLNDIISRLTRGIGITNEKLDLILKRIEDAEARVEGSWLEDLREIVDGIINDLEALESPIIGFFEDVEQLQEMRHPQAPDFYKQVYGLEQRRQTYINRLNTQLRGRLGIRSEMLIRETEERRETIRRSTFGRVEDCIQWVRVRLEKLSTMQFVEDLEQLESMFEEHKIDNHEIQEFRQNVDECIAHQAEVPTEDTHDYCDLLSTLESEYQQLRDLSAGRMLDLDSLIAFVRGAQQEIVWINDREDIEVTRNWSDINQLDLPALRNYYQQLLHEIELRDPIHHDVYNKGVALLNQGHPAVRVIDFYVNAMKRQWDWLLGLTDCFVRHLRDARELKAFMEDAAAAEDWMIRQTDLLERKYDRHDFSLEEGEQLLRELDEINELIKKYHDVLMKLMDNSTKISPLWQRGERIQRPMPVTALTDYADKNISIKKDDECMLLDNSDLIHWVVRGPDGVQATVPSVVFRIPPPDTKLTAYVNRLHGNFEKLRRMWDKKHRMVRFNMVLNTMGQIRAWDLDTFLSIDPEARDQIIKALNDDVMKLLSELDPNDPMALRLQEELRLTNDHFYNLLNASLRPKEPDLGSVFDEKLRELLEKLEGAYNQLNDRVAQGVPRTADQLEKLFKEHKAFEEKLQGFDVDVSNVKELFRQLPNPTPSQRANYELLDNRWRDIWQFSQMYVERLKVLERVLFGIDEVADIVKQHEITLNSFDDLPAALGKLRGAHSQLLEMNMVLRQQQNVIDSLNHDIAVLRQHIARTRQSTSHPDVDHLENDVQNLTVRWENVCAQVAERLKTAEESLQTQMVYRSGYENEIAWLDRVEDTINSLRRPEDMHPEQYQQQLDVLLAEYAQLQERTEAIESVNREGGKFIRQAKSYDAGLAQYLDNIVSIHGPQIREQFRRPKEQPKNGAQQVTEELEYLNRRLAQLSSFILERRNIMQVLIQKWKRQKQEEEERRKAEEEEKRRQFEIARLKALDDANRLRLEREAAEARRKAEEEEAKRKADEEARKRQAENEARKRKLEEEELARQREEERRKKKAAEDAERDRLLMKEKEDRLRKQREDEERRQREKDEAERLRKKKEEEDALRKAAEARRKKEQEDRLREEAARNAPKDLKLQSGQMGMMAEESGQIEPFEVTGVLPGSVLMTEVEDEVETFAEETVIRTQFYEMEGITHKQTGEILTFVEAVRQGLLDLHSGGGEFYDIVSGGRISLEKAVELGYVGGGFREVLETHYGIFHPETKQSLSLIEAIQIGLYDPDIRQLRDINTGVILSMQDCVELGIATAVTQSQLVKNGILKLPPIPLDEAFSRGVLNKETGQFTGKYTGESMPLKDALYNGYIRIGVSRPAQMLAVPLSDCIYLGLMNASMGEFHDKKSGMKLTLDEAVSPEKSLVNLFIPEIMNTQADKRETLNEAIKSRVIDTKDGKFRDLQKGRSFSLQEAFDLNLIQKPMTLTEIYERGDIDSTYKFLDAASQRRYTLLEAITAGLLDPEVRHIVDHQEVISIAEALEKGLLEPDGAVVLSASEARERHLLGPGDEETEEQVRFSIPELYARGLLTKRKRHSLFDIKGFRNTVTSEMVNFNAAVEAYIIILDAERIVDLSTNESYLMADVGEKNLVDSNLLHLLMLPTGILDVSGQEMSVMRAVAKGFIDPTKCVYVDKRMNREFSPKEAYENGLLTLLGAIQLTALFDIHPSLISVTKKGESTRRIHRPGQPTDIAKDQVKVTLAEAMRQGLIDAKNHIFVTGDTRMSLEDALTSGLLNPTDEWIVPSKDAAAGPTIEEKVKETITETGQQLAPKYYPEKNKNVEESVTTVKRVRTTETTAVGGPGGVSVYRAITGGKGAFEVPAEGFHIHEAEQRGFVDMKNGVVTPPGVDRKLSLEEALKLGVINDKNISFFDTTTKRTIPILKAMEEKLINANGSVSSKGRMLDLQSAIEEKIVIIEPGPLVATSSSSKKIIQFPPGSDAVMSFRPVGIPVIEETEHSWSFDTAKGEVTDDTTGERISLDIALARGVISPADLLVHDTLTGREMSFEEAEKWGVVDMKQRYYLDKVDNTRYSFADAAKQHRIYPAGGAPENAGDAVFTKVKMQQRTEVMKKEALSSAWPGSGQSLSKFLSMGCFDGRRGMFVHPMTRKSMTLKQAIMEGLLDPYSTVVVDKRKKREISLIEAISEHLVDDDRGTVTDTETGNQLDLQSALENKLIKDKKIPQNFEEALVTGRLDLNTGLLTEPDGSKIPLQDAIAENEIARSSIAVRDPASGEELLFSDAEKKGIVNVGEGVVFNKGTFEKTKFPQALSRGMIFGVGSRQYSTSSAGHPRTAEQSLQLTPFAPLPKRTEASITLRGSEPTETAREEMFNLPSGSKAMVKVVKGEGGVEQGKFRDPGSGMTFTYQLQGDPYVTKTETKVRSTSQVKSIDVAPHAELVGIDKVKDKRNGQIFSLQDAQRRGLVHVDKKGKETTRTYSVFRSNLPNAIEKGVVDLDGEKISLKDAIRAKLIDIVNLKYNTRKTGELTFSQAANMGFLDATLAEVLSQGVYNPVNGERISTKTATEMKMIDLKTGDVYNPWADKKLSWLEILKPVYMVLTKAGVYDPAKGYKIPVLSAIADGLIDVTAGMYFNRITMEKTSLEEAMNHGLIDAETLQAIQEPFLTDFRTGRKLSFIEAVREKLADPRKRTVRLDENVVMPIARATAEGKISASIGKVLNRIDKLNFAEALGKGLVDVKNDCFTDPETGRQMSISQAISEGYIDTGNVLAAEEADEANLSNILYSPDFDENSGRIRDRKTGLHLTFEAAVEKGVIDGNSLIHSFGYSETMTIKKAMDLGRIDSNGNYHEAKSNDIFSLKEAVERDLLVLIPSPMEAAQKVTEAVKRRDAEGYKFKIEPAESRRSGPHWRDESSVIRISSSPGRDFRAERVSRSSESGSEFAPGESGVRTWSTSWQGRTSDLRQPPISPGAPFTSYSSSSSATKTSSAPPWARHE